MLNDDSKYFSLSGDMPIGGPTTWHVTDWDQRRIISVTMDGDRYSSELPLSVYRIYVSDNGEIITKFTDAKDDQTSYVHYLSLRDVVLPDGVRTIRRDELEELDRLGPDTDLIAYPPCANESAKKVVFKYYFLWQYAPMFWKEMNLWMRLPRHPNIAPFDSVVIDELEGRIIGFVVDYIPGGNLEENTSRVFKLDWLRQLIRAVDDLNLRYGISHQDIAPRNLLVDESTDSIMLCDFNYAARMKRPTQDESESYIKERNDVKGVVFTAYEIITRDDSLRMKPHEEQILESVEQIKWEKHPAVKLDYPVEAYREVLREWQKKRKAADLTNGDTSKWIHWPPRPKPPKKTIQTTDMLGNPTSFTIDEWSERRQDVLARGGKVLNWERPPQQRLLDEGIRVLATGEIINC
ncbi:kinase-like domain-containing protein [Hypoxylon trugodes]|uniref:kinase-like domain-containing protein n=1 Tax=Hypoxylon trugodes TaxID=326681 RepID=UPI0021A04D3F|nr:kinase-like domain-containing protein [Hypoxylon trugodes]KAI1389142.1 kinase-like domain-containing protein [Hypoxylon trugodes]